MPNPLTNLTSRLTGARLHLGVTAQGIALTRTSSAWNAKNEIIGEIACTPGQLPAELDKLLAQRSCQRLPLMVTLGQGLGQLFVVTPPSKVVQHAVLEAAAGMRFQTLFGKNKAEWYINGDWQVDRPFLACAYPQSLLTMLRDVSKKHLTPILTIKPYFVAIWNVRCNKLNPNAWFGVVHDGILTLGMISPEPPRSLIGIRVIPIPEHGHTAEWLEEQLHRTALQHNLSVPELLQVVGNNHAYCRPQTVAVTNQRIVNLNNSSIGDNVTSTSPALQMILMAGGV